METPFLKEGNVYSLEIVKKKPNFLFDILGYHSYTTASQNTHNHTSCSSDSKKLKKYVHTAQHQLHFNHFKPT